MKKQKEDHSKKFEPTKSELEILKVLWQHGPSTVRFVNDTLNQEQRPVQYTSTLKLMQIMAEKGILKRDETNMKHIYSAVQEAAQTKSYLLDRFIGSPSNLMMQLLGNKKTSKKEWNAIRELINKMSKDNPAL